MRLRKALIIIGGLIVVSGLTVVVLSVVHNMMQPTVPERGIKPTNNYVFQPIANVSQLTAFTSLPGGDWKVQTTTENNIFRIVTLVNNNSCSLSILSGHLAYPDKSVKDFGLSKELAMNVATGDQGILRDDYVITVPSTHGNVEFYSALYDPKLSIAPEVNGKPSTPDGFIHITTPTTIFIATRAATTVIQKGTQATTATGVLPIQDMIPDVIIRYTCHSDVFSVQDVLVAIRAIKLDFATTVAPQSPQTTTPR